MKYEHGNPFSYTTQRMILQKFRPEKYNKIRKKKHWIMIISRTTYRKWVKRKGKRYELKLREIIIYTKM